MGCLCVAASLYYIGPLMYLDIVEGGEGKRRRFRHHLLYIIRPSSVLLTGVVVEVVVVPVFAG